MLTKEKLQLLHDGAFIPAHPLALTEEKQFDLRSQKALTRYYMASGVDGIAVGVHTTQFEIRDKPFNLYETVLETAAKEVEAAHLDRPFLKVAGICGETEQALDEAKIAKSHGYDLGLVSFRGLNDWSEEQLLAHCRAIANVIPIFGFYLQPAVGGRLLSFSFWKQFAEIDNVLAIKIAPFDRYQTLDVVRAVCHSSRKDKIALYTGNDDNIVIDLLTNYRINVNGTIVEKDIVGGLLGHWAVWTKTAVDMFRQLKQVKQSGNVTPDMLNLANEVTDANGAFFDVVNHFVGSISGINEVLARQGILQGNWCLMEHEKLGPGQKNEIDRVYAAYPHLHDDAFIKENKDKWFAD